MASDTVELFAEYISSPYSIVDSASAALGCIWKRNFHFTNTANTTPYYIIIKHRNGLETWSAAGNSFTSGNLKL